MTIKQYRCIAGALTIRTQPRLGDQFKTNTQLKLNELITVNEDSRVEADGFFWLQHERGWSAERSVDGKLLYLLDNTLRPKDRMWGINIDPANPAGKPLPAKLAGLGWVRFVFHISSRHWTPEQAFAFYDPVIEAHTHSGTRVLLILLHDTFAGNLPWLNNGDWNAYIRGFAQVAGTIAQHYRGKVAAYEIWNEGDQPAAQQTTPTSIYLQPPTFASMLLTAAQVIKQADPAAKIISGGLVSGDPIGYLTKAFPDGNIPADGIGLHPYGLTPPDATPFPNWSRGSLVTLLGRLTGAFPGVPIWITEFGVPGIDPRNHGAWPGIANYMNRTFALIRNNYFHIVPTLIWFGWSDSMDNAGIVTSDQQSKGMIFDTFFQLLRTDQSAYTRPASTPFDGKVLLTQISGDLVAEQSIAELVQRIHSLAPNVKGLLVKSSLGATWEGPSDNKKALAISGPGDLARWTIELAKYRMDLHALHEVWGSDIPAEIALVTQAAQAPGVMSLVLDLDASKLTLKSSDAVRNYMLSLRRALPGNYHIGLSFDGRPDYFKYVHVLDWYPFINSWHPKIFHWQFSGGQQGPATYLAALFEALKNYARPIVPMLQAEPTNSKPVPPAQIRQAARLSFESYPAVGVSYWRLGAIGPQEFAAIQGVSVPWAAGLIPTPPPQDTLITQTTAPLRIRTGPSLDTGIIGYLQPGERINALERKVIGSMLWVRHDRGWSMARNGATGEIYLA
jgi:hypothetical protein